MNTMFDFITHIKGVEYILAIMFIAGYILFWEALKPRPFRSLVAAGKADAAHLKEEGRANVLRTIGKIATAPFIGLAYIAALPIGFAYALGVTALNGALRLVGKEASFGWSPIEAYLGGKKRGRKKEPAQEKKEEK